MVFHGFANRARFNMILIVCISQEFNNNVTIQIDY